MKTTQIKLPLLMRCKQALYRAIARLLGPDLEKAELQLKVELQGQQILELRQQLATARLSHRFTREAIQDGVSVDEAFGMFPVRWVN